MIIRNRHRNVGVKCDYEGYKINSPDNRNLFFRFNDNYDKLSCLSQRTSGIGAIPKFSSVRERAVLPIHFRHSLSPRRRSHPSAVSLNASTKGTKSSLTSSSEQDGAAPYSPLFRRAVTDGVGPPNTFDRVKVVLWCKTTMIGYLILTLQNSQTP